MTSCPARRRVSAFTLAELAVGTLVMSIIMMGMASTVVLVARSVDSGTGPASQLVDAGLTMDRIAADLNVGTDFSERGANATTFTVPDRNNDGALETIRYAWSGIANDPLTRSYNGAAAANILNNVTQFDLSYLTRTMSPAAAPTYLLLTDGSGSALFTGTFDVTLNKGVSQYFVPTFVGAPSTWSVKKVRIYTRSNSSNYNGICAVQIRTAAADKRPTSTILEQGNILSTSLPDSFDWFEATFNSVNNIASNQGLCLVILYKYGSGTTTTFQTQTGVATVLSGCYYSTTSNGGSTWTAPSLLTMINFMVYGTTP